MNLKHLRYFWAVAHMGSVASAARFLHLTPQTISAQIKLFEEELGATLLRPAGRGLELTEAGRVALSYADEMFALGDELQASVRAQACCALPAFRVGTSVFVPKSLTRQLLAPMKELAEPVRLICREGQIDWLLGELALNRLDVVLADRPMPAGLSVRCHSHKLGESAVSFFATPALATRDVAFPASLHGAPLLLPGPHSAVRREIDRWLGKLRLSPRVVGEFDDSALMKAFAQEGEGFFPAPAILSEEISVRYGVQEVGRLEEVREAFWLISTERHVKHPAVRAVLHAARTSVFAH